MKIASLMSIVLVSAGLGVGLSSSAKAQSAFGAPLFAVLNGGNECNAMGVCQAGDPNGIGSVTITFAHRDAATRWVCFGLAVDNIPGVTLANLHNGVSGANGPIVLALAPSPLIPGGGDPGASGNCVPAPIALVNAIRADPTSYYVNVRTVAFPNGAIRGQLH